MKIGIVCPYNVFRPGGVQEAVFAHQKELIARGYEVTIITPNPRQNDRLAPEGVHLVGTSTELNTPFRTKADISLHAGPKEISKYLEEQKYDLLHFHEPWVPMLPRQIIDKATCPIVATFHAKLPEAWIYKTIGKAVKPYTKSFIKDIDYMVAASEPAADHINSLIDGKVQIIYNGVDLTKYDPETVQPLKQYIDETKTILFINRLEKRKGPDWMLKAYRQLVESHEDVRLVIASDGDMRKRLESYVKTYELPNVEFLGFVDDETKVRLYASADLYCSPAPYGEGFGIVLLEAMAMHTPYVAGDNAGYRFATGDKSDEYLVDPTKPALLAKRIEKLLYDEEARVDFKKWAKKRVHTYDYRVVVDEYETIYKDLIRRGDKK